MNLSEPSIVKSLLLLLVVCVLVAGAALLRRALSASHPLQAKLATLRNATRVVTLAQAIVALAVVAFFVAVTLLYS